MMVKISERLIKYHTHKEFSAFKIKKSVGKILKFAAICVALQEVAEPSTNVSSDDMNEGFPRWNAVAAVNICRNVFPLPVDRHEKEKMDPI